MKITLNSIKKTVLLTGGLFLSVLSVNADNVQDKLNYFRTPEASAFKKYGEESVNEYTGTAEISVPLYTIKNKDIEIPLVLRYDASGIKVEQEASWVGLGWNLMVGGCINYVCAGKHDLPNYKNTISNKEWTEYLTSEFDDWIMGNALYNAGIKTKDGSNEKVEARNRRLYYTYQENETGNWMLKPMYGKNSIAEFTYFGYLTADMEKYIDYGYGERDFYSVNVMGKSFMFFIDPHTLKVFNIGKAGEEFVVTPDYSLLPVKTGIGNQPDITSFKIKDSDGYTYEFSDADHFLNDSRQVGNYSSCWYLTTITSPLGATAQFKYSVFEKPARQLLVNSYTERFPCSQGDCQDKAKSEYTHYLQNFNANTPMTVHYLKTIKTGEQTVTFLTSDDYECSGKRLDNIVVSYDENTIKNINFSYGSFTPSNIGGNYAPKDPSIKSQNRLKLNNVNEIASGETLTTSFSYNEDVKLPSKRSYAQDYWGYYNGKENTTLVPIPLEFMSETNEKGYLRKLEGIDKSDWADRFSDGNYMQAGILKQIVYPTGGYTRYEYEPHIIEDNYAVNKDYRYKNYQIKQVVAFNTLGPSMTKPVCQFEIDRKAHVDLSLMDFGFSGIINVNFVLYKVKTDGSTEQYYSYPMTLNNQYYQIKKGLIINDGRDNEKEDDDGIKLEAGKYLMEIQPRSGNNVGFYIKLVLQGWYDDFFKRKYLTPVGGLRVKSIDNYDNNNNKINHISYDYTGSLLLQEMETIDHIAKDNYDLPNNADISRPHVIHEFQINIGHPHFPEFYLACNPGIVGYSTVTKKIFNGNGKFEKKIVTSYENRQPIFENGLQWYSNFMQGKMLRQDIYNSNSLLSSTSYEFGSFGEQSYGVNITAKDIRIEGKNSGTKDKVIEFQEIMPTHEFKEVKPYFAGYYKIQRYPYILCRDSLIRTKTIEYCSDGDTIITTKNYSYNDKNHQVSQIDEYRSKNEKDARNGISLTNQIQRTKITYIVDVNDYFSKTMVESTHRLNDVVATKKILVENGKEICMSTDSTRYASFSLNNSTYYLPWMYYKSLGNNALEARATYLYDGERNVRSVVADGMSTVYIWSYIGQYPIAKIEGLTLSEVVSAIGDSTVSTLLSKAEPSDDDFTLIRDSINKKGGYVTTYTYKPLVGITSETLPNGLKTTYRYDGFGRLTQIIDHKGSVISTYSYNYKK